MIVTLTPNPAADKTLLVPALRVGGVNRAREAHLDPGGKGINASRVVHRLGHATLAVTVLGGHIGRLLGEALAAEGVPYRAVRVDDETRLNVILHDEATGASTRVWDRGAAVPPDGVGALEACVREVLPGASALLCAGTLPPGMPPDFYARVLSDAAALGIPTVLDSDGDSFRAGLAGRPTVIKPNVREASALLGRPLATDDEVIRGARELMALGPSAVVVSMGAAGSLLVTADRVVRAVPPPVVFRSAVGSGDSMVAGLLISLARRLPLEEGLRIGSAAGAATAMTVGTQLGSKEEIETLAREVKISAP